jgi:hypothetical protein
MEYIMDQSRELGRDKITRMIESARKACRDAAVAAWEDALIRGLCAEGAFEAAMNALDTAAADLQKQASADLDAHNA